MNRKDFRPNTSSSSKISDKDRKIIHKHKVHKSSSKVENQHGILFPSDKKYFYDLAIREEQLSESESEGYDDDMSDEDSECDDE